MRAISGRKIRICIVGAGAVGGLTGAWFARAGHEVCLVARGAHLEALRRDGLTLLSNGNRSVFPIPASDDPADFGTQDAVFVCLKTHSIAAMVPRLKTLVGPDTMVVPAINTAWIRAASCSRRSTRGTFSAASCTRRRKSPNREW